MIRRIPPPPLPPPPPPPPLVLAKPAIAHKKKQNNAKKQLLLLLPRQQEQTHCYYTKKKEKTNSSCFAAASTSSSSRGTPTAGSTTNTTRSTRNTSKDDEQQQKKNNKHQHCEDKNTVPSTGAGAGAAGSTTRRTVAKQQRIANGITLLGDRAKAFAKFLKESPGQKATFDDACETLGIDRRRLLEVVSIFEGAGLIDTMPFGKQPRNGICQWRGGGGGAAVDSTIDKSSFKKQKEKQQLDAWIQWMQGRNAYITKMLQADTNDFGGLYITRDHLLKQQQQQQQQYAASTAAAAISTTAVSSGDMLQLILATQRGSILTIPSAPPVDDRTTDASAVESSPLDHFQYSLKVSESNHRHQYGVAPVPHERPIAAYILEGRGEESNGQKLSKLELMPRPPLLQTCCSDFSMKALEGHAAPPQLASASSEDSTSLEYAMMVHAAFFESSSVRT